jgi:AbrB family looped-hinge helix DNA binding protein
MAMQTTISSTFQVTIPKVIRERLALRPGQKVAVLEKGGIIHLVPERDVATLRGIAIGHEVAGYRDKSGRRP